MVIWYIVIIVYVDLFFSYICRKYEWVFNFVVWGVMGNYKRVMCINDFSVIVCKIRKYYFNFIICGFYWFYRKFFWLGGKCLWLKVKK